MEQHGSFMDIVMEETVKGYRSDAMGGIIFSYRIAYDMGFAPCIDRNIFTLACCKGGQIRNGRNIMTGLRYHVGQHYYRNPADEIYLFGIYKNSMLCKKDAVHIIHSYLQTGEILDTPEKIKKCSWHPHADLDRYRSDYNALYLASEKLSLCPSLPGCGVLSYREDRVLTMEGKTTATWREYEFLMPDHVIGNRKNSARRGGLYYQGQWQELILKPDKKAEERAVKLLSE